MSDSPRGRQLLWFLLEHATTVPDDLIAHVLATGEDVDVAVLLLARPELGDADAERLFAHATRLRDHGHATAALARRRYAQTNDPDAAVREAEQRISEAVARQPSCWPAGQSHDTVKALFARLPAGHPVRAALPLSTQVEVVQATASIAASAHDLDVAAAAALRLDRLVGDGILTGTAAGTATNHVVAALRAVTKDGGPLAGDTLCHVRSRVALRRWLDTVTAADTAALTPAVSAHLLRTVILDGLGVKPDADAAVAVRGTPGRMLADAADASTCADVLEALAEFGRRDGTRDDRQFEGFFTLEEELARRLRYLRGGCPVAGHLDPLSVRNLDKGPLADWLLRQVPDSPNRWAGYTAIVDALEDASLSADKLVAVTSAVLAR